MPASLRPRPSLEAVAALRLPSLVDILAGEGRHALKVTGRGPRVMLVSEEPLLRLAIARELMPGYELIPTLGTASADRRLEAGAAPEALIVDLDTAERAAMHSFLEGLVGRGFTGPRVLLSSRFTLDTAPSYGGACHTHFALARAWRPGQLRALVESVLGLPRARPASQL